MTTTHPLWQTLDDTVAALFRGRPVIAVCHVEAGTMGWVTPAREHGAGPFLLISTSRGIGAVPEGDDVHRLSVPFDGEELSSLIAHYQGLVDDPPPWLSQALQAFDPERRALVVNEGILAGDVDPDGRLRVWGRDAYGPRTRVSLRLEDKSLADELWRAAGIPASPYRTVSVRGLSLGDAVQALRDAAAGLDAGNGTVWSADASRGMNGGAERVVWVPSPDEVGAERHAELMRDAASTVALNSDVVRLQPYLDGVPCSIHGFVMPSGVAVFRPMELHILVRPPGHPNRGRFDYTGVGTLWDPPPARREEMRDAARRVGCHLATQYGYRGAFCIDGILTPDGFFPTELNPRLSGGLNTLASLPTGVPLQNLHQLAQAGVWPWPDPDTPWPADEGEGPSVDDVERPLVEYADAHRTARFRVEVMSAAPPEIADRLPCEVRIDGDATGVRVVSAPQPPAAPGPDAPTSPSDAAPGIGVLKLGMTATGGAMAFLELDEWRPGVRGGMWAVAALNAGREVLGLPPEAWIPAGASPAEPASSIR